MPIHEPIENPKEDTLSRSSFAESLADEMCGIDASKGYVVAITGTWGSGKTSFINLIRSNLSVQSEITVVDFNPWMFSGTEQLATIFFQELSAQLKQKDDGRFSKAAKNIAEYGEMLRPLDGISWIGWISRSLRMLDNFTNKGKSIFNQKKDLETDLKKLNTPIVIVVDDIDRLESQEIRDIFRLVRLTANFPNIVYVLAFDRNQVEAALSETGINGRNYLEKVTQNIVNMPPIKEDVLLHQLGQVLEKRLDDLDGSGNLDEERWPDTLAEIIKPLINNMRDAYRLADSTRVTLRTLDGEVELGDVLALETVRVFMPDVFQRLTESVSYLTEIERTSIRREDSEEAQQVIDSIVDEVNSDQHKLVIRSLIKRIFPAARTYIDNVNYTIDSQDIWLKERRVAHKEIFNLYLSKTAGEDLGAFYDAEKAFEILDSQDELDDYLRSLEPARLEDVIGRLEVFEHDYPHDAVVPTSTVLLNILSDMPKKQKSMWGFDDPRLTVSRVVLRLLRTLSNTSEVETAVYKILPQIKTLTSKLELITLVGYEDGGGHKLVSKETATKLEEELNKEVRSASPDQLVKEQDLLRLLLIVNKREPENAISVDPDNTELSAQLLKRAQHEVTSQEMDKRYVKRETRLAWNPLVKVFGNEDNIRQAVDSIRSKKSIDEELESLLDLTEQYLEGWRPEE